MKKVFVNALKLSIITKSQVKTKSKSFKVMIAYISYDIKIGEKIIQVQHVISAKMQENQS